MDGSKEAGTEENHFDDEANDTNVVSVEKENGEDAVDSKGDKKETAADGNDNDKEE